MSEPRETLKILVSVHVRWWNASAYYAVTAAEALVRRGHEVTILAHRSTPAYEQVRGRGLAVQGDINLADKNPLALLRQLGALTRLIREEGFDVLNPHRPEDHFMLALARKRVPNPPRLVRTVSDVRSPRGNVFNRILHRNLTEGMIYCARVCQNRYHEVFDLSHLLEGVIYSALDVEAYIRGDWKFNNNYLKLSSPRIGIIARLSPNKGHRTLIDAAATVVKEMPEASFIVVGKEEEVKISELQQYAKSKGIEHTFTFTGLLDDPHSAIAACDIGVIASTDSEVISRAAQEFFAFGIPVVASRVNVLPEMVEPGVNGLLFEPGNADELAEALIQLGSDEEGRRRMGERARALALKRHDLTVFGEMTEAFFRAVSRSSGWGDQVS